MQPRFDQTRTFPAVSRCLPVACALLQLAGAGLALVACDRAEPPPPPVEAAIPEPAPEPAPAPPPRLERDLEKEPLPAEVAALPPRYQKLYAMLVSDEVLMEWKHEIVLDDLAPDPSDAATTLLILATTNPSVPISMASLMALSDRVDDRVEQQLIRLLRDPSWKRRAWSARILGQTGRRDALGTLTEILGSESDTRVRRQLEQAIAALQAPSPAAEAAEGAEGAASGGAGG